MATKSGKKRAGPSTEDLPRSSHATKKTRFVEPADDPANFEEKVNEGLEDPSAHRKGRVKTEGYDSDSSDEGEGVVFSRRKGKEEEAEDDMFAVGDKEDDKAGDSAKKKKTEYLRLGDIEGQEFNDGAREGDESEESDDPEDEDAAERKKKEGMGFELSSFNMREEMEEGKFTEDGSYVRSFDAHAVHDRWMEGVDERQIKLARRRKREQDRIQREKMKAEEREIEQSGGKPALELQLVPFLKKGESVLEALQRLGAVAKKKGRKSNSNSMQVDKAPSGPTAVETITHLASNIMSFGDVDVYSKTYEELVRSVRSSGLVEPDWDPPSADVKYEYKWDMPGTDAPDQTFGPFSEEEMKSWYKAHYFGQYGEKVKVRPVGGEWGDWDDVIL
ncbi:hypothetical protein K525DRAFT_243716 [Schizophyllum commune Loenen D]|nr:hypothetical protein K525DRAFT_243716 [Schizophyllum commune Loenen D]